MKYLTLVLLFLSTSSILYGQYRNQPITILGNIIEYKNQKINIIKIDKYEDFRKVEDVTVINPDSSGSFAINLNIDVPQYYIMGYNHLYLTPGDTIEILLNLNEPEKTRYKGKSELIQEYLLNSGFARSGSFLRGGLNIQATKEKTLEYILSLADDRYSELAELKGVTEEFRTLENARIRADLINSIDFLIPFYNKYHNIVTDSAVKEDQEFIKNVLSPKIKDLSTNFINPKYLELTSYRKIITHLLKYNSAMSNPNLQLIELRNALAIIDDVRRGKYENNTESDHKLKEKIGQLNNTKLINEINYFLEHRSEIRNGAIAANLDFEDNKGNLLTLAEYKGKVIYIDFWATWCGPCIEERQYFKKLREKFSDENIVFISLSIDRDKQSWLKFNSLFKDGKIIEARLDPKETKKYNIAYIPRYILIDKNFKIIELYAPKPSSREIHNKIIQALGI